MVKKLLSMTINQPKTDMPRSLAEFWQAMRRTDMPEAGQVALRRRLLSLQIRTAAVERKRLLIVESMTPLRAAGYWMPELAELVGADLVISRKGDESTPMTVDEISIAAPDVIIVACSMFNLAQNSEFASAFANDRAPIFVADAVDFFCKPDARLVDTAEILAEILHQDSRLQFGHEGRHWRAV
jgi:ABC-type Fe3+-hydroxamate transport system substrate-binding protein